MTDHSFDAADESEQLIPCPFCGGRANVYVNEVDFVTKWSVGCGDCNCNMDVCEDTPADAAVEWNTRVPDAAQACAVRLEARPADNSKEWTEIFPAQLEWVAKEGHQVRAIELAAQPPAAPVETDDYTWYDAYNKLSAAYMGLIAERDAGAQCSAGNAALVAEADGVLSVGNAMDMSISGAWAFIKKARDALAAIEPQSVEVWQPIETAPQDGTEVIGLHHRPGDDMFKSVVLGPWTMMFEGGKWVPSWNGFNVIRYMSDFGTEYQDFDGDPTHWQPTPPPPFSRPEPS